MSSRGHMYAGSFSRRLVEEALPLFPFVAVMNSLLYNTPFTGSWTCTVAIITFGSMREREKS